MDDIWPSIRESAENISLKLHLRSTRHPTIYDIWRKLELFDAGVTWFIDYIDLAGLKKIFCNW